MFVFPSVEYILPFLFSIFMLEISKYFLAYFSQWPLIYNPPEISACALIRDAPTMFLTPTPTKSDAVFFFFRTSEKLSPTKAADCKVCDTPNSSFNTILISQIS